MTVKYAPWNAANIVIVVPSQFGTCTNKLRRKEGHPRESDVMGVHKYVLNEHIGWTRMLKTERLCFLVTRIQKEVSDKCVFSTSFLQVFFFNYVAYNNLFSRRRNYTKIICFHTKITFTHVTIKITKTVLEIFKFSKYQQMATLITFWLL